MVCYSFPAACLEEHGKGSEGQRPGNDGQEHRSRPVHRVDEGRPEHGGEGLLAGWLRCSGRFPQRVLLDTGSTYCLTPVADL